MDWGHWRKTVDKKNRYRLVAADWRDDRNVDCTREANWEHRFDAMIEQGVGPCRKPGSNIGISWFLEERNGNLVVSQRGGDDGFITSCFMIPSRKFAFVMMTNSDSVGIPVLKQIQAEALNLAK